MYRLLSAGLIGEPCGVPRPWQLHQWLVTVRLNVRLFPSELEPVIPRVKLTGLEAMPSATTVSEYVPYGIDGAAHERAIRHDFTGRRR